MSQDQKSQELKYDAIIILSGGIRGENSVPLWVQTRIDKAVELQNQTKYIITTSAATPHKALPLNESGQPLYDETVMANILIEQGGPKEKILLEQFSKDTIENSVGFLDSINKPHLLTEIGKERIRRAAKKIKEDNKDKDLSKIDFGFRVFKLDSSNMKDVYYNPKEIDQRTLKNFKDNIKDDRTDKDLLYQVLLELAIPISAKVKEEKVNKKTIYRVNENFLIACFEENVDLETIKQIAELKPLRIVFKDSSFKDDATKVNCDEYLKNKLPNTSVKVI